ncbi:MAG: hydroxymethylbilane synthase [Dehalococcoidia bacterium]|nr:hydroxymethylbilane synthase [Dehalococcoidia bacterium]
MVVRIGSRGSQLALAQTGLVVDELQGRYPQVEFAVQVVKTSGDRPSASLLPLGEGVFVKELEEALQAGAVDLAVHSLKDVPSRLSPGFVLAAVLKRGDARDVLVSRSGQRLSELPPGARIGTGSPRRKAQVASLRPDLLVVPIRGNVDTRLRKTYSGDVDGVIMAAAAMHRLGWEDRVTEHLPLEMFLPAVGQGALVIETLSSSADMVRMVAPLEDEATRHAVAAERAFLRDLGGGCRAPIAAYATVSDGRLFLKGMFLPSEGASPVFAEGAGPAAEAEEIGAALAKKILSKG